MKKARLLLCLFVTLLVTSSFVQGDTASATDARTYNAGIIIDDAVFTNNNTMSVDQIQAFMNSKVPGCAAATCLKNYRQNIQTGADNYGGAPSPAGSMSSAEIIKTYANQFYINPQVLLVTLQKENGLVTNTQPSLQRFQQAMGYGCPDNRLPGAPACNPATGTFSAQMYQAARHFRGYFDAPAGWWVTFRPGANSILFRPSSNCGSTVVNIQNRATAALYTYTPYQPNQAALNAGYGSGDGCSSYGNRNFFLFFSDWFGSPIGGCLADEVSRPAITRTYDARSFDHFYTSYDCEVNISVYARGQTNEGAAFYQARANDPGMARIHRLYNPHTHMHLWTASQADIDAAITRGGYSYEGVAFYGTTDDVASPGAVRVHRLYNPRTFMHLWTTSQADIDAAISRGGYSYEGVAFFAYNTPQF